MKGQIYKIFSDLYYVNSAGKIYACKIREILKKQKISIVTGDFVEFDNGVITNIFPQKSFIKRPAVANINQIVIVTALKDPELDLHQLNRYITLAKYYKIPTVLCFNKEDLGLDNTIKKHISSIYGSLGYKIIFTSAIEKLGMEDFYGILRGKITALCGNSGVGKSSLINALNPNVNLKTKPVSDKLMRGTHTTRHCEIIPLDKTTGIVDTPGFSNVKFDFILPRDVGNLFVEIAQYKGLCKFSDCLHINETGCEVIKNLDKIDSSRYESYCDFVREAFEYKEKIKYNGTKKESSRKLHNDRTVAKISGKKRSAARNTEKQRIYKEVENEDE